MAVQTVIPLTDIKAVDIRDTLANLNAGNVSNVTGSFFLPAARINQWSLDKPMRGGGKFYATHEALVAYAKAINCGLVPQENTYIKDACLNKAGNRFDHTYEETVAQHRRWVYNRPTGGESSPYRLGDFKSYRADAIAPDGGYQDYDFKRQTLVNIAGYTISIADGAGVDWYLNSTQNYRIAGLSIRTGEASWEGVNQNGLQDIPISYIQGNINTESWRFGIAVYIPVSDSYAGWQLFVSDWTTKKLSDGKSGSFAGYMLPNLVTNQQALLQMVNSAATEFQYLPVLVKNCQIHKDGAQHTYVYLQSDSEVYSTPSGYSGGVITKLADTAANPLANGLWSVRAVYSGNDAQYGEATWEKVPVNNLMIFHENGAPNDTEIHVTIQYSYTSSFNPMKRTTTTITVNRTVPKGTVSIPIIAEPALQVLKSGTHWYKP